MLRELGRGVLALTVLGAIVLAVVQGSLGRLPWPWLLAGLAAGLVLSGSADLLDAVVAGRRARRADEWLDQWGEEE